jgi:hypothetical protein
MRSQAVRTALYAALAVGVGGAVGGLWTDNPTSAQWSVGQKCALNATCGGFTASGPGLCQTGANCAGTNDGSTFNACFTDDPSECHHVSGSKTCPGVCQDFGQGPCLFTLGNCDR